MPTQRLDKILRHAGWGSRNEIHKLIHTQAVTVNGITCVAPDRKFDPQIAIIHLNGEDIDYQPNYTYILHKPAGLLTATTDAKQETVYSLLPMRLINMNLTPVGRLDKDTTGLLLLTTDGALSHALTSPRRHVEKEYHITVDGVLRPEHIEIIVSGIILPDGLQCKPAKLNILTNTTAELTITEGKYHQVKRMMAALGCQVVKLHRSRVGGLRLEITLPPGQFRRLTVHEIEILSKT